MIGPIPPATPDPQGRQPRQSKPQTKPETFSSHHSQAEDDFQDSVQLSPEALAAAHDGDVNHDG
jgi:hypothetical protein